MSKVNPILLAMSLVVLAVPLSAQQAADSAYLFRLEADKDMLFVSWNGNGQELARLPAAREAASRERCAVEQKEAAKVETQRRIAEGETRRQGEAAAKTAPYTWTLRANLLRWATLTPDIGVEWRIKRCIGILINGSRTSWSWSDKTKKYALWKVSPEVRYYIGKEKRGFLGAMYHIGEFNYKLGETGKQGNYRGGGITGGYQLELNRSLSLDFHAGLGYTRAEYDKYNVMNGVRVRQGSEAKNYWGINQLGITLVWKLVK